ncbi:hypothetical protein FBU30_000960 [Linnemannia zychae]|nr:hypothetical protein FBU30_000960 [Linnemannia zychae]
MKTVLLFLLLVLGTVYALPIETVKLDLAKRTPCTPSTLTRIYDRSKSTSQFSLLIRGGRSIDFGRKITTNNKSFYSTDRRFNIETKSGSNMPLDFTWNSFMSDQKFVFNKYSDFYRISSDRYVYYYWACIFVPEGDSAGYS